jgi:cell division septum initiation protein DivIVA
MMMIEEIEEVRLAIQPFTKLAAIDQLLGSLGDLKQAVADEERGLAKAKKECREKRATLDAMNTEIAAKQGKAVEIETAATAAAKQIIEEALAKAKAIVDEANANSARIVAAAEARAATIEEALSGAQSSLLRARRAG